MQRKHSSKLQRIYAGVESLQTLLLKLINDVEAPLGLVGAESEVDVFNGYLYMAQEWCLDNKAIQEMEPLEKGVLLGQLLIAFRGLRDFLKEKIDEKYFREETLWWQSHAIGRYASGGLALPNSSQQEKACLYIFC